ncbi:MAG: SPOR domain-containing protein [Salinivirgaceae bacterium]
MISKYLKELIANNNRIIIPDFGAFMIQDTPEGKQISFNDFLKFNDGLLINQIIKAEKISKTEAGEKITAFIQEVEKSFASKKPYEIKEVGFLVKDNLGNIKFETKVQTSASDEPTASPTDVKPTIILDEAPVKETTDSETPKKDASPAAKTKVEKTITEPEKSTEPVKPTSKPESKSIPPVTERPKTSQTEINKPISNTKQEIPMTSSSNNSRNLIIILTLVIIIVGGGVWSFFAFDLKDKFFGKKEVIETPVVEVPAPVDTLALADTIEEPVVVEEPVEPVVEAYVKKYYVVAGSFKVASNAERYQQKLLEEGYASEIVMRSNGFHIVSYKTLFTWRDALSEWKTMRQSNAETWIFIK